MQLPSLKRVLDPELIQLFDKGVIDNSNELITVSTSPLYKGEQLYEEFFENDRTYTKFVKKLEVIIRSSPEMRRYIQYLKNNLDLNSCSILKNADMSEVKIELHHYPFSLYDITHIVLNYRKINRMSYSTIEIAEEVVHLHYQNVIGLIPVSETIHDLAHSGSIILPLQDVYGNYKAFIQKYNAAIHSDYFARLRKLIEYSQSLEALEKNNEMLEIRPVNWQLTNEGNPINSFDVLGNLLPDPITKATGSIED